MTHKMDNEVVNEANVKDSQETRLLRFQSSSSNAQIDVLRVLHAQLEQESE